MKAFRRLLLVVFVVVLTFSLIACGNNNTKITIIQYVSANALDNARVAIIEELEKEGYVHGKNVTIKVQNPNADPASLAIMAEQAVQDSDMIFAIATPVAIALKGELEKQGKDVPTFFTAVTDPVDSKIVQSDNKPGGCITGTSDMNPVALQISLVLELNSEAKKVGVVFTSSEANSIVQVKLAREKCKELGLTLVEKELTSVNDLQDAIQALVETEKVDAIYLPTDNIVADNMSTVVNITNSNGVPTICGEEGLVADGGTITYGIDYSKLGAITARMAIKVLKGETNPADMPVERLTDFDLVINTTAATNANINIPAELLAKADRTR